MGFKEKVINKKQLRTFYFQGKYKKVYITRYKLKNEKGFTYKFETYEKRNRDSSYAYRGATMETGKNLTEAKKKFFKMSYL